MRCNLAPSLGLRLCQEDVPAAASPVEGVALMSPRERVRRALRRRGPMTMEAIAAALGMPLDEVRPVLYELVREDQVERQQTFALIREPGR